MVKLRRPNGSLTERDHLLISAMVVKGKWLPIFIVELLLLVLKVALRIEAARFLLCY
jgi:hypothetical protein